MNAAAVERKNELRKNWLNPTDPVDRVPEVVPGYTDRTLPDKKDTAKELNKCIHTNLCNARPARRNHPQKALVEAVTVAYGWGDDWRDSNLTEDIFRGRIMKLNQKLAVVEPKAAAKAKAFKKPNQS